MANNSGNLEIADIPRKWIAATAGTLPIVIQSISYTCYAQFFLNFHVQPNEVGYDFASLLGKQAGALIIIFGIALVLFSLCALGLASLTFIGASYADAIPVPEYLKKRFPRLAKFEGRFFDVKLLAFLVLTVAMWRLISINFDGLFSFLYIPILACLIYLEYLLAHRRTGVSTSIWAKITEPKHYSTTRILIIVFLICFIMQTHRGYDIGSINLIVATTMASLMLDRSIVRPRQTRQPRRAPEQVRIPIILTLVASVGACMILAFFGLGRIDQYAGSDQAIEDTAAGRGHISSPFSGKSLLVPDSFPVEVSWSPGVAPSAIPNDIAIHGNIHGVLLGAANGTSVIWWPEQKKTLRLPSSAITITATINNNQTLP